MIRQAAPRESQQRCPTWIRLILQQRLVGGKEVGRSALQRLAPLQKRPLAQHKPVAQQQLGGHGRPGGRVLLAALLEGSQRGEHLQAGRKRAMLWRGRREVSRGQGAAMGDMLGGPIAYT